jgi:trehalose/maltose hydrolase-like predicted phosphorylase
MIRRRFTGCLLAVLLSVGCSGQTPPRATFVSPHAIAQVQNDLFLKQKTFDPWKLSISDPDEQIPVYFPSNGLGSLYSPSGALSEQLKAGQYYHGMIASHTPIYKAATVPKGDIETLDLYHGVLSWSNGSNTAVRVTGGTWPQFWSNADIGISGDPEAQQVTHAELFYLCGSATPGKDYSIAPMGLSSTVYDGHIFWDAEIWMMPALLPQHPDLARTIVDYRFTRLKAAEKLAQSHGFSGAEYPWESASTGLEEAPEEFSHERHVTADVAYAAWSYYLWTGDRKYLTTEGWPILSATANYWASRVSKGPDGKYHIKDVLGADETSGEVSDDAWTNGVVRHNLESALLAAHITGHAPGSAWQEIETSLYQPFDAKSQMYLEYSGVNTLHLQAKQADTQMLIYPLDTPMNRFVAANTLEYSLKHTNLYGPAMSSSINAVIAARLGLSQESLDLYHDSYRPFMRGPWDAFSEKRTKSDVYFTTGMGGNLQAVLYGFAGLNVAFGDHLGAGTPIDRVGDAALYANPHLPPGWSRMAIKGIRFRGDRFTVTIGSGNHVTTVRTG